MSIRWKKASGNFRAIYALMESLVCKKNYIAVNKGLKMNENNLSGAVKKQVESLLIR